DGTRSSFARFLTPGQLEALNTQLEAGPGDLLLLVADDAPVVADALGALRLEMARRQGLAADDLLAWAWVTDFPLFEWDAESNRWDAAHHPFTAPRDEDVALLDSDPGAVRSKAYDVVCNGWELGSGSIRIHDR